MLKVTSRSVSPALLAEYEKIVRAWLASHVMIEAESKFRRKQEEEDNSHRRAIEVPTRAPKNNRTRAMNLADGL